jgi:hypothetical protein
MASPTVDRRFGLVGNTANKAPVTVLAASNITLSGQQTIDGVSVLATNSAGVPDRVLCIGQTSASQNGIWDVGTGAWTRAYDANGNFDLAEGTTVLVNRGTTYAGSYWKLTTTGTITIGTTSLTWTRALGSAGSLVSFLQAGTGAVQRTVQEKLREVEINVADFLTETQLNNVKAGTGNATTDRACIQAAFDALPTQGGTLVLPAGTLKLDATYLNFRNKSNFTVRGAGMGVTLIDGAAHVASAYPVDGIIAFGPPPSGVACENATFRDFSIRGSNDTNTVHMFVYRGVDNVLFDRLEIYNGYDEAVYCDGGPPALISSVTVRNCHFHDNYAIISSCINTNTVGVSNILVENNLFERVSTGMYLLGKNIRVVNNAFVDVNTGVNIAESNFNTNQSIDSCVVANNTFHGLGRVLTGFGGYAFTNACGISSNARSYAYSNNGADNGIVIANNSFKETYGDIQTTCIRVRAGALVQGNFASGCQSAVAARIFIQASFSSDVNSFVGVNSTPTHLYIKNNVCENKPAGSNFSIGLYVLSVDNAYLHCSGNHIQVGALGTGAGFDTASNGFLPFISVDGDVFAPSFSLYDLAGNDAGLASTFVPVYGTNTTTFRTASTPDLYGGLSARNLGGSATPSIAKGVWFWCQNGGATTITEFLNAPSYVDEITIHFTDANTTVQHDAAKIRLNGAANFVSSVGATLTLWRPGVINSAWVEKSRCIP